MLLTVVRHLPTEPYQQGASDFYRGLSEYGESLGPALARMVPEHRLAYVSPYPRCLRTAEYLRDRAEEFFEAVELRESTHPGLETYVRNKPLSLPESAFDLRDRVARFLDFAVNREDNTLLVTHADVVNAVRWYVCGLPTSEFLALFTDPANFIHPGSVWTFDLDAGTMVCCRPDTGMTHLSESFRPASGQAGWRVTPLA